MSHEKRRDEPRGIRCRATAISAMRHGYRLQITITVNMRTRKMEKNVYKKNLFSIDTVYYVYCTI